MSSKITIDPVTRLEGHGKIEIILDDQGNVSQTYWQVAELRGFERFCVGRPAEEMTRIMPNICGVCPSAHHLAAMKALDRVFGVEPPPAAKLIRELEYNAFIVEDHYLHFFFLAAPDFIVGPALGHGTCERQAVSMQAEDRAEDAILEPAHDQLTKIFRVNISAVEAADIGGPPGDAAHGHIQPGAHLGLQRFKGRGDIA